MKKRKMNAQEAKRIPLSDLLAALGHTPAFERGGEKWYLSPFRKESTASFKLSRDERAFYDHGAGLGGNILDLTMQLYGVSVGDALRQIERLVGSPTYRAAAAGQYSLLERAAPVSGTDPAAAPNTSITAEEPQQSRVGGFTDVSIKAVSDGRLLRYLQERAIPPALARDYLQEIRYTYHEKRYFALAFPNDHGSFEMRNPYYQGVYGKKAISTVRGTITGVPSVAVFEGVFDFLSALVLEKVEPEGAVIVMNSVAMKGQTLAALRRMKTPTVRLFLDNDRAGQTLALEMREELSEVDVVDCSGFYAGHKDVNAFLQAERQQQRAKNGGILA